MENQLLLNNFLETVIEPDEEKINYYGEVGPFPSLAQAELNYQFNLNLKNKVLPSEFEKLINEVINSIKLDLEKKYKYYFFLLYNICYLKKNRIDLIKNSNFNFSKLNKLLFATEKDVIRYYNKFKQFNLN